MKMIFKPRCFGKTTQLIHTSEITDARILTETEAGASQIKELAKSLGCKIKDPISIDKYIRDRGRKDSSVLLDLASPYIIEKCLNEYIGCKVDAVAFSINQTISI